MGVPGCPEFAACTASMHNVRMVLMLVKSMFCFTGIRGGAVATLMKNPLNSLAELRVVARGWPILRCRPPPYAVFDLGGRVRPPPFGDVGPVDAVLVSVLLARNSLVGKLLANSGGGGAQARDPIDGINGQGEAVGLVADGQFQGRVDVALLLVAAHVDIVLAWPPVGESMDQPRVSVEG